MLEIGGGNVAGRTRTPVVPTPLFTQRCCWTPCLRVYVGRGQQGIRVSQNVAMASQTHHEGGRFNPPAALFLKLDSCQVGRGAACSTRDTLDAHVTLRCGWT